jgi:MFS family permease
MLILDVNPQLNVYIVFQPSFGSLSNIFGRKPLMLTALLFFLVGTIVAGTSTDFLRMLVGRSIQGIGGGGVIVLTEIIVTDLVPLRLRGQYFGILGSMLSIGSVTGPLLGGGFSENASWVSRVIHRITLLYSWFCVNCCVFL